MAKDEASAPGASLTAWRERDWVQLLATALFLALACLLVGLQVKNSIDVAQTVGVRGAKVGRRWLELYAVLVVLGAALAAFLPRRLLWIPAALGGLALTSTLVAVATGGGEIWSLLVALLTITSAWFLGRALLRLPLLRESGLGESGPAALATGFGLLGLVVFLLGLAGLIRWWTVGLVVAIGGVLGLVRLAARAAPSLRRSSALLESRLAAGALAILGIQGAYATVWAAAPEIQYDALQYKAWLPAFWAHTGQIDSQTFIDNPRSVYLGLDQLVATPGHALGGPGVGRYLQLMLAAFIVIVVWRLGSRIAPVLGPIAALIVGLTPQVAWQATTAYDDIFLAAIVLGGGAALVYYEGRRVASPLAASLVIGFIGGTGITGKLHVIPFAIALCVVWCLIAERRSDFFARTGGCLAGLAAGALPVLVYRWVITGNPVFPYFNQVFKSPDFFQTGSGFTSFTENDSQSVDAAARFVWSLIDGVPRGIEVAVAGVFGLLVASVAVAALFGWRGDGPRRALWGVTVISLLLWWIQFRYLRFALPYAILAVIVALPPLAGLARILRARVASVIALALAAVAAAALIVSTAGSLWNVPGGFPLKAAVGSESERAYLERALLDYTPIRYLSARTRPGDGIIGQVWGRLLLPLDVDLKWAPELEGGVARIVELAPDAPRFKQALDQDRFRWIVLADDGRQFTQSSFLRPLVERYGQIVFADHLRDVYRLVDKPEPRTSVPLCDESFAKPSCWFGAVVPDTTPGVTAAELQNQPIGQAVSVCPGATYALTLEAGPGAEPARIFWVFDVPDPEQALRTADAAPGRESVIYQTAPAGATSVDIIVQPLGPSVQLRSMRLAIAKQPDSGPPCA